MVICAKCGERNPADAEFCGACGAFLEWDGARADQQQPVAQPVPSAVETSPSAEATQPPVMQPVGQGQRPPRWRPPKSDEDRRLVPGDLICGDCGKGNTPTRRFCSRCGAALSESEVVKIPWWRRLIPKRKPKAHKAGSRPGRDGIRHRGHIAALARRIPRLLAGTSLAAVVLAGILYGTYSPFRQLVNDQATAAKDWADRTFLTQYTPVRPTTVTATTELPGHPANLASDNAPNTYWAAPTNTAEPALILTFDRPVEIRKALLRIGIGAEFQSAHRPQKLHLVYSTGKTHDLTLADTPDAQEVEIDNSAGATSIEIHVVALHRSLRGNDVAISEIELFERS